MKTSVHPLSLPVFARQETVYRLSECRALVYSNHLNTLSIIQLKATVCVGSLVLITKLCVISLSFVRLPPDTSSELSSESLSELFLK